MGIGVWVVRNIRKILALTIAMVGVEVVACWWGFARAGRLHPLLEALETTGSFLMTLSSPKDLSTAPSRILLFARCAGWVISFIGWLTIPVLIGISLSRSQTVDQERDELRYKLLKYAERAGAPLCVDEALVDLEKLPSGTRHAQRNVRTRKEAVRKD